ncbi:MAG: VanW family protein [Frankiales bacterium]|nr:VanW family protein [Frankiales bacterium]
MPARRALLIAGGAVLVAGVTLGAGAVLAGDDIPRGTYVAAVDVGGLSRPAAEQALARDLPELVGTAVAVTADGEAARLDPVRAGLTLDAAATTARALTVGPLDRLLALVGRRRDVPVVTAVDRTALAAELTRVAATVDRAAREGAVRFTAEPVAVPSLPLTGRELQVDRAVAAVAKAWPATGPIELPVRVTPVRTTAVDVERVLREVAVPAVAHGVTVTAPGGSVVVEPLDIAKALRIEADDTGALTPRLEQGVLYERLRDRLKAVGQPPVDATFRITDGKPVLVASKGGTSISPADLGAAVMGVLATPAPRTAAAPLSPATARVTTERARTLGIVEPIGSFTTSHPCCRPRVQNIHAIADLVDGYVLLPGEQFDLNAVVGPRDKARGFVEAPQILDGEFVDRVGGGVSQFATTLFNAVFFSGLKDIAHSPHSYYISRYPPGREATVSFPQPALVFENDSPTGVLITTAYTGTSITVTFWGTKRFDEVASVTGPRTRPREFTTQYIQRPDCTASAGGQGFDIVVTRVLRKGGQEVGREDFRTRYQPEPKFVCGPPPS